MSTPDSILANAAGHPGAQVTGTQQAQPATPPPATPTEPVKEPQSIPYDRFREVNEKAKAAEAEAAELRKWKADQEAAQLSEIEKAQKAADEATSGKAASDQRALDAERRFDVWKAAHAAGFEDPEDAVVYLQGKLAGLDDADKIATAVKELSEQKPKLLGSAAPATPTPIGGLTPRTPTGEVPVGADGQPDVKLGMGRDLLASLTGRKA